MIYMILDLDNMIYLIQSFTSYNALRNTMINTIQGFTQYTYLQNTINGLTK